MRRDSERRVHFNDVSAIVEGSNDVACLDVGVGEQRHQLLALQLDAVAVVFHVAHHQQLERHAVASQPLLRDRSVHDRASGEDDDVVFRSRKETAGVREVEAAQRVIIMVAIQRVFDLPVDSRDAPAVVGDAVVNV